MMFAVDARQNFFDVVETAHQAGAEVEAGGPKSRERIGLIELIEPGPQGVVDYPLERQSTLASELLEAGGNILFQCQRGAHRMMS